MSARNPILVMAMEAVEILQRHLWLWVLPTMSLTLLAAFYAAIRSPSWQASQALVVRDEAGASENIQGRFNSIDMMQTFQETILEVARNRIVVAAALKELGPPSPRRAASWPTNDDIEGLQDCISVKAPQGAEFGRTEVIYLAVTGETQDEAVARTSAVCDQLELHLSELRRARAKSLMEELTRSLAIAQEDLDEATHRLELLETEVGSDLGELRILNDSGSGEGNLRLSLNQVDSELRQSVATQEANQVLRDLLAAAQTNPDQLLTTPGLLLESQPALRKLKDGLVDAQLRSAQLLGHMSPRHPLVIAATASEQEIRNDLHDEVASALRGVAADLRVTAAQIASLEEQREKLQERLDTLASLRARYSNLVDDVRERTQFVQETQRSLAETRATQTVVRGASLLTRFHQPSVGDRPVGPSNKTIVAGGFVGGLSIGIGFVVLTLPIKPQQGRRWSDYLNAGRRATDKLLGRRAADRKTSSSSPDESQRPGRRVEDQPNAPR